MNRVAKPVSQASVDVVPVGDVVLVNVSGLVDERFSGFGSSLGTPASIVINVGGITRMTSFGVRQWLKAMDALPKRVSEVFLLGCPTFFVDQLNMVLNFAGAAKVLTVGAPYTCTSCGAELAETIDVLAERTNLANGAIPEKHCTRCSGKLEFDESPESYFAFVSKYGASTIEPRTAAALASLNLYTAHDSGAEKPPRIIKLVNESVTYFRIIGRIASMFRARPFLVGAEGEVVIDLAEVEAYDAAAQHEWRRLLKNLSTQVSSVTLVDIKESFLPLMGDMLKLAKNISVASITVRHQCPDCGETSYETEMLHGASWPLAIADVVCASCASITHSVLSDATLAHLQHVAREVPPASLRVIDQRAQLLERALNDANVQPSEITGSAVGSDDAILGKYKIVRRLPVTGGIADAFLAKQVGIGGFEKPVVLKKIDRKLLEANQQSSEHMLQEIKSAGRLAHPNIVQVLDVGEVDGALYLATEYVHGKSLAEILGQLGAPMPIAEALHIVREVAHGLDHAFASTDMAGQQLAVVHGDLAPHNIMISYDGAVKVLDFGVVMASIGTRIAPEYVAPEAAVDGIFDHASDLFSLGVLLYVLCAGTPPFSGSMKTIVKKMKSGRLRALDEVAGVPPELGALAGRLLSFELVERPERAAAVVAELTEIARHYGLESSSPAVGALVTRLFPIESASHDGKLARTSSRDLGPAVTRTSSRDLGPAVARTSSRDLARLPIDESAPIAKIEPGQPNTGRVPLQSSRFRAPPAPPSRASRVVSFLVVVVLVAAIAAGAYFLALPALGYYGV